MVVRMYVLVQRHRQYPLVWSAGRAAANLLMRSQVITEVDQGAAVAAATAATASAAAAAGLLMAVAAAAAAAAAGLLTAALPAAAAVSGII
jgi:hypothetical protein